MNKAIAVFNMPKGCMQCPCMYVSDYDGECHCAITRESVEEYGEGKVGSKPKWCLLKELPNKIDVQRQYEIDMLADNFLADEICKSIGEKRQGNSTDIYLGWNACIRKILGDIDE